MHPQLGRESSAQPRAAAVHDGLFCKKKLLYVSSWQSAGNPTQNFIRNRGCQAGVLPCSDLACRSFADDGDFIANFYAGYARDVHRSKVHADVANDGSIIIVDDHAPTGRKLAVQAIAVSNRDDGYLGGELGYITAAVAHHLAGLNFADLNDSRFPR